MELSMCILTDQINLNNLKFNENYIKGIVSNKDKFIGIPLVVNRIKLENGFFASLDHALDKNTNLLKTDTIGTFIDFREETDPDGTLKLMGDVRIFKRYPTVCEAIVDLYESGDLEFSCEAMVYGYESTDEETGVRSVDYEFEGKVNSLFGSCIVSEPAEVKSKPTLLVAQALEKDLGEEIKVTNTTEVFNKNIDIAYHGKLELSSLKFSDVSNQIYNILNPVNPRSNYRTYNYYIQEMYVDHVIVEDEDDYKVLFKINYRIENDIVILDDKENWVEGYKGFIPKDINIDDLISLQETQTLELEKITNELNTKHKEESSKMEEEVKVLNDKIEELENKVKELNSTLVGKQTEIQGLQENEKQLNSKIEELEPYKSQVETAEKERQVSELQSKYQKVLSEDLMKSEEVVKAINELNSSKLDSIVVAEILNKSNTNAEDQKEDNVIVTASKQQDLIPQSAKERLYAPRN
ncbi:hypothetical protein [Paenibacillus xylanexedens]|uniref:hypothetical protein n=1 Tax=Paenibacillus xylanexedens TaxID=528191 RepID=UPI0011A18DB8|nr:hypothetical protein [Paenibacillus xylanexedens]